MKSKFSNFSKFLPVLLMSFIGGILIFTPLREVYAYWIVDPRGWGIDTMAVDFVSSLLRDNTINLLLYWVLAFSLKLISIGVDIGAWMVGIFLDADIYTHVFGAGAIETGWTICRDMCNLFFVMFLLVIAFATIFRVQAYSAKALLPKFIIAIFLINFSKVIATIVIDFGQIFMFQFVDWMGSDFGGTSGAAGCLTAQVHRWTSDFSLLTIDDSLTKLLGVSFAVVYAVILMATYFTLAGLLLIRIIALALLIVLSPFAFLLAVFPETRSKSSEWWKNLVNYSLLGPVFVFFIYLATEMGQELTAGYVAPGPADASFDDLGGFDQIIVGSIKNFVAIGMLLASVTLSKSLAGAGAGMVIGGTAGLGLMAGRMYKGARYGYGKGKGGVGYAGRKVGVDTGTLKQRAYGAVGKAADKIPIKGVRNSIKGSVIISEAGKKAEDRKAINEEKSKYKELTGEQALLAAKGVEAKTLVGKTGEDNKTKIAALIERAIEDGVDVTGKENSKLVSIAKSKNINADEVAKHDPHAAEALGGKTANEYFEKHAEDGSWKKYKGHVWDKDYGSIQKEVNNDKLLRDYRKTAGKDMQGHIDKGAEKNVTNTISKYTDSHGHYVGPHAEEEIEKAAVSADVVTGDIRIGHGARDRSEETGEVELTDRTDADGKIEIDTDALKGSVDKLSENFKNFNTDSKKLFGKHAKGVAGLDLKGQSQGDIDALIEGLRLNTSASVKLEAGSMAILSQRIKTLGYSKEFGIGNKKSGSGEKEGEKKEKENKWDKGAGYV